MNLDFRTGIVKVIQSGTILVRPPNGRALGTGFLVKESGLIVTCAHVVRSGQDAYFDEVDVEFTAGNRRVKAQVLTDFIDAEADVAFLEVGDDIPEECNSLPLGTSEGRTEHEYQSYGFPDIRKWSGGLLSRGMIVGIISDSHGRHLLQLSQSVETKPGFSGAPVWDVRAGLVVGMVAGGVGATRDASGMPIPVAVTCEAIVAKNPQLKQVPFSIYGKSFQMIEQQTNAFLTSEQGLFIHGGFIHRNESTELIDAVMSGHGGNTAVLLGESGIGKSALLTNIIAEVRAREWPVLAFSLNSVAESVSVTDQLGRQLGLDASPAAVLAEAAGSHECLIVIDQVDFASRVSGKYPQLKKAVRLLREEAGRHSKMRLLFACRASDYENDIELKEAIKSPKGLSPITLSALTHEIVVDIVARWGWANIAKSLTKKQLDLLSVPLHLRLFRECCDSGDTQLLDFHTSLDLFDKYWAAKQRSIEEHRGRPVAWWDIVKKLAEHMSNEQLLRAPAAILGKDTEDAEVMVSEHVLVREGHHFRFFHESFFDYAFARVFVPEDKPVSDLLRGGEQHLFRRSQIRFILSYEREKYPEGYERDLKSVLLSPDVRHHVKSAVLDLLKGFSDPTEVEWETLLNGIKLGSLSERDMWQTIHRSRPWFELLDKKRTPEAWLEDTLRRQRTIIFLSSVQEEVPDRVVQIIESLAEPLESWRDELLLLLERSDVFVNRRFFEFFLRILDAGILDGIKPSGSFIAGFWSFVHIPALKRPNLACEALGHYLIRGAEIAFAKGYPNPFVREAETIEEDGIGSDFIIDCSRAAPESFVRNVLPFTKAVAERNFRDEIVSPREDIIWGLRDRHEPHTIASSLLRGMEEALMTIARNKPEEFRSLVPQLENADSETLHYLLVRGYTANGQEFCEDAVKYLCRTPRHLEFGYIDSMCWASRELIEESSYYCSKSAFECLEKYILNYNAPGEKPVASRYMRYILLDGMREPRLSAKAKERLRQLEREFPEGVAPPSKRFMRAVPSPIPKQALEKMTDEDWLGAIRSYPGNSQAKTPRWAGGDISEVANDLEKVTKQNPKRFARLLLRFEENTPPDYYGAILRGISGANVDINIMAEVCRRCHNLSNHTVGLWLCWLWEATPHLQWPDDVLEMVIWYATKHPDPTPDKSLRDEELIMNGFNSVRGKAAIAIGQLIGAEPSRVSFFSKTVTEMIKDSSLAVRSCTAFTLIQLYHHEPERAVKLFEEMCESRDVLLTSRYAKRFVATVLLDYFTELRPLLERCLLSEEDEVASFVSGQIVNASISNPAAESLAVTCITGRPQWRMGAAHAYGYWIRDSRVRAKCEEALTMFFSDANPEVREAAAEFFRDMPESALWQLTNIIRIFRLIRQVRTWSGVGHRS